ADLPHCALLPASCQGLWGPLGRRRFPARRVVADQVLVEEAQAAIHPRHTPLPPAEARTLPSPHHVPSDLPLHPAPYVAEAFARIADPEVPHPPPQDRVDLLDHPGQRLRAMAAEDRLELPEQLRPLLELGGRVGSPPPPQAQEPADVEAQEAEALPLRQIDRPTLLLVQLDVELCQLLP